MGDTLSTRDMISKVGNPLVHGKRSEHFQSFLKKSGLEVKSVDAFDPSFKERMILKLNLMKEYDETISILLSYYKNTGARGLTMLDELVHLKSQILEREQMLQKEGTDPLTDRHLSAAKKREFEIIQFLEKIKYDKEKTAFVASVKKEEKDDNIAFTIEVEPDAVHDDN